MPVKFLHLPAPDWAAPYIGTEWVWGGSTPETGFDCGGWLHFAWTRHWGVSLPDWQKNQTACQGILRAKQGHNLIAEFLSDCHQISAEVNGAVNGAGVLMKQGTVLNHVGIYDRGDVIHACEMSGSLIRERVSDIAPQIMGFYVPAQTWIAQ